MKGIIASIIGFLSLSTGTWAYNSTLANYVTGEYGGKADSLNQVLVDQFMNKTKGTFWSTPKDVDKSSTYIYIGNRRMPWMCLYMPMSGMPMMKTRRLPHDTRHT